MRRVTTGKWKTVTLINFKIDYFAFFWNDFKFCHKKKGCTKILFWICSSKHVCCCFVGLKAQYLNICIYIYLLVWHTFESIAKHWRCKTVCQVKSGQRDECLITNECKRVFNFWSQIKGCMSIMPWKCYIS